MIYLDTAASFPLLPEVKTALAKAFDEHYANSSSAHLLGQSAHAAIEEARELIADEIGAYPSEIVFTSGATESNNIALKSILLANKTSDKKHIITSAIEHKCILAICNYLQTEGYDVTYLSPNSDGLITCAMVESAIKSSTALVTIMHANNELGTINDIGSIGQVCFKNNVLFHTDAAQSFAKLEIDVDDMNIDLLSISAHKIAGPKGIGAIYIRDLRKTSLQPVIHGAGQEEGVRGGTVAAPLIQGFATAIEYFPNAYNNFKKIQAKQYLLNELSKHEIKYQVNGGERTVAHCLSITLFNVDVALLIRANEAQFCLAQGSACSSKEIEASHVLSALGLSRTEADATLRISFSLDITCSQIDLLVSAIQKHLV